MAHGTGAAFSRRPKARIVLCGHAPPPGGWGGGLPRNEFQERTTPPRRQAHRHVCHPFTSIERKYPEPPPAGAHVRWPTAQARRLAAAPKRELSCAVTHPLPGGGGEASPATSFKNEQLLPAARRTDMCAIPLLPSSESTRNPRQQARTPGGPRHRRDV